MACHPLKSSRSITAVITIEVSQSQMTQSCYHFGVDFFLLEFDQFPLIAFPHLIDLEKYLRFLKLHLSLISCFIFDHHQSTTKMRLYSTQVQSPSRMESPSALLANLVHLSAETTTYTNGCNLYIKTYQVSQYPPSTKSAFGWTSFSASQGTVLGIGQKPKINLQTN